MKLSDYEGNFDSILKEVPNIIRYEDIEQYLPYAGQIEQDDLDFFGKPIKDYDSINLHYLALYDTAHGDQYPTKNFEKIVSLVKEQPSIDKCQMIFVGPHSVVPWHRDGMKFTDEERDRNAECNMILPVFVPKGGKDVYALQIEDDVFAMDQPFVFESKYPHYAWNKSDNWWVMLICHAHKSKFKI